MSPKITHTINTRRAQPIVGIYLCAHVCACKEIAIKEMKNMYLRGKGGELNMEMVGEIKGKKETINSVYSLKNIKIFLRS